ncbi:MAG: hypothetical protein QOJ19_3158 [Acidimicrobiia bacterium]|nr:hypothetical protein [Acidimicrobiia bacterium]
MVLDDVVCSRRLEVALVSEHASPLALLGGADAGGQNVHVAELARHIGRRGAHVTVYTRRDDPALPTEVPFAHNVVVRQVDAGPAAPLPKDDLVGWMGHFAEQLGRLWRDRRPDVVHAHFWMSTMASLPPAHELGIPVATTFHALGVVKRRHQGAADTSPPERVAVEQRLAREVDMVIATSRDEVEELMALGMDRSRAVVIPCGVDVERFTPDGPSDPRSEGTSRIVAVSRFVARKGLADLVDAVALAHTGASADTGIELVIAGGPPAGILLDDAEARRLATRVHRHGIGNRVRFLGAVERAAVPRLLRSADVVAMCPWYEPFGIVALEAMACGIPVVASDVGGLRETVLHGTTGLLVPPRRPDCIAEALHQLLSYPQRPAMADAAVTHARRYSWSRIAGQTLAQLRNLACAAGPAPTAEGPAPEWSAGR